MRRQHAPLLQRPGAGRLQESDERAGPHRATDGRPLSQGLRRGRRASPRRARGGHSSVPDARARPGRRGAGKRSSSAAGRRRPQPAGRWLVVGRPARRRHEPGAAARVGPGPDARAAGSARAPAGAALADCVRRGVPQRWREARGGGRMGFTAAAGCALHPRCFEVTSCATVLCCAAAQRSGRNAARRCAGAQLLEGAGAAAHAKPSASLWTMSQQELQARRTPPDTQRRSPREARERPT